MVLNVTDRRVTIHNFSLQLLQQLLPGLPQDGEIVHTEYDGMRGKVSFVIRSDEYEPVLDGCEPPVRIPVFKSEQWMDEQSKIIEEILEERVRQDQKWGIQTHELPEWATILGEEYGELCQEILRVHFGKQGSENLRKEAVQVAAVVVAMLESLSLSS